jgi:hypothetical protein
VGPDEDAAPSAVEKILCVRGRHRPPADLFERIESLELDADRGDGRAVMESMKALIGFCLARPEREVTETAVQFISSLRGAQVEQTCPKCSSHRLVRSHAHSVNERVRKQFTAQRLFRCGACGWRGWLLPAEAREDAVLEQRTPPDFSELDYKIGPHTVRVRDSFSPRNLA